MEVVTFGAGLLVAGLLAFAHGGAALRRTAIVLALNWLGVIGWAVSTGRYDAWGVFAALDAVSAFVILKHPASRPQAVIGVIYIVAITVHLAYALVGHGAATMLYLTMLSGMGWLQIITLAAGALHNGPGRRMVDYFGMGSRRADAAEHGAARVEHRK